MKTLFATLFALGLLAAFAAETPAQVAFTPTIGQVPDGVILNAVPVVSHDRRYVRLHMNPIFTGAVEFNTFSIPAAVAGFGGGGGLGGGFRNVGHDPFGNPTLVVDHPTSAFAAPEPSYTSPSPRQYPTRVARSPKRPSTRTHYASARTKYNWKRIR